MPGRFFGGYYFGQQFGSGLPLAPTFFDAIHAFLDSSLRLSALTGVYRRRTPTGGRLAFPCMVINNIGETPVLVTPPVDVPTWLEVQFTVLTTDDIQGEDLRDAAYSALWPTVSRPLLFRGGGEGGMRLPGRKWESEQQGRGPSGANVWAFMFSYKFYLTRPPE